MLMEGECRKKTKGGKRTVGFKQSNKRAQLLTEVWRPALVNPPSNIPKLTLQKFQEGVDDMSSFLKTFEVAARAG